MLLSAWLPAELPAAQDRSDCPVQSGSGKGLTDRVSVTQTGCIGLCQYEPIVEVMEPGKPKVTYIKMTAEKAAEVVERHLIGGHIVENYTLNSADIK